jgi:ACR3 family arsenite efflux pump ArsB
MSTFERYLTVWVALCILAGIALGHVSAATGKLTLAISAPPIA